MAELDEALVRAVDRFPRGGFSGLAYRHVGPGHPPMSAEGSRIRGGRWNPPESFPTLYLTLDQATVVAEFLRHAERQGMPPGNLLPRKLVTCRVELSAVLDLRDRLPWQEIDLGDDDVMSDDMSACQRIGDAAHYASFEGLLAPSATGAGDILAIFTDRLRAGSRVEPIDTKEWTSLPERNAGNEPGTGQ